MKENRLIWFTTAAVYFSEPHTLRNSKRVITSRETRQEALRLFGAGTTSRLQVTVIIPLSGF